MGGRGHTAIGDRAQIPCGGEVAGLGRDASQCVEGEDLHVGVVVVTGLIEDCDETLLHAGIPVLDVDGGEQTFAERSLLATSGGAVPRRRTRPNRSEAFTAPEGFPYRMW